MNTTIPFYDIANRFLLGFLFAAGIFIIHAYGILVFISELMQKFKIPAGAETIITICFVAAIYEIGVILNRISSVATEEFLIWIKAWPKRSDYVWYNKAKEHYKILPILAREYDFYKGHITLFLLLAIYSIVQCCWLYLIVCLAFAIIFIASGRKQSKRINVLVKEFEETTPKITDMMV